MVILLYIGFAAGFLAAAVMFVKQTKRIHKRTGNEGRIISLLTKYIIRDMILGIIVMIIFSFLIPYGIWAIGKKDMYETEMIISENDISAFDDGTYVKEESNDNGDIYVVNEKGDTGNISYEKYYSKEKDVEFISGSSTPKYEEVLIYKIKSLKDSNFVNGLVNDMFANIYMESKNAEYVGSKVKIYIP